MRDRIPQQFRRVDLSKSRTWSNATLFEWIEMRRNLKERADALPPPNEQFRNWIQVNAEARRQLRREDAASGRKTSGPLSGLQRDRLGQIAGELWDKCGYTRDGFSDWERDFMRCSSWIDAIVSGTMHEDAANSAYVLFEWVLKIEDETDLRRLREDDRVRRSSSVAVSAPKGTRAPRNKNAFLPHPLELMGIYRRGLLVLDDLKQRMDLAEEAGVVYDEYDACYPCPRCSARYVYMNEARQCCEDMLTPDELAKVDSYCDFVPPGDIDGRGTISEFFKSVWDVGYETAVTIEGMLEWDGWRRLRTTPALEFAKDFVGFMFGAAPATVRRKLGKSSLDQLYDRFRIAIELRYHLDEEMPAFPSVVFGPDWFNSLDDQGHPDGGVRFHVAWTL